MAAEMREGGSMEKAGGREEGEICILKIKSS